MTRKGRDIDLFIQSFLSLKELYDKKTCFYKGGVGQDCGTKIDVVIYCFGSSSLPIHEEAREMGIPWNEYSINTSPTRGVKEQSISGVVYSRGNSISSRFLITKNKVMTVRRMKVVIIIPIF